jgi:cobalamin biosynthetic protein CobC
MSGLQPGPSHRATGPRRRGLDRCDEAAALDVVLAETGLDVIGGTALYRLVRHPEATRLHEHLASIRIWVRRFDWAGDLLRFGLPSTPAERARLAAALLDANHR